MSEAKTDIYATITNKILADMEKGILPWNRSWNGCTSLPLRWTGENYSGINILMLWATSMCKGYSAPTWMTFNQALELGAAVRKGERGTTVVYAGTLLKSDDAGQGDEDARAIHYLKRYTVFNVAQIDGLPDRFHQAGTVQEFSNPDERNAAADEFFTATAAQIETKGHQPAYFPLSDKIEMPAFADFKTAEDYYSTLSHELTHWTGHKTRLAREIKSHRDSIQDYAKEELIAELGAAFLCAELGISSEPRADHAAYLQNWIQALKNDKKFIFSAASHASKAVDYLNRITGRKASTNQEAEA